MRWVQLYGSLNILWHCLSLGLEWKLTFQSCGHCWVFQICWHTECSTFTASSFSIWNSSTGIPSPPLALFIVTLPKDHLTSDSRMSGSGWVITPLWLSGSLGSFLYSSTVYSFHLFLISLLLLGPYHFCPLLCPSLHILGISNFLEESFLFYCFPLFLCIDHLGRLFFFFFKSLLAILWNSAFRWIYLSFSPLPFTSLLFQLFVRTPQTTILLAFLHLFFLGLVLITASSTMLQTSVYSFWGTLSIRSNPLSLLSLPLYNHQGFDLGHTWMV